MTAPPGERHDLIVIGGGVYGIVLTLLASKRGLRPLLLERDRFAAATSAASLRILHGGLRYLQTLNLSRMRESIAARAWWRRTFPDLVRSLPCLMPLYGDGLKRPLPFRLALAVNDGLGRAWDADPLPPGRIVDADTVRRIFPAVPTRGLAGGAIWHDAFVPDMPRLLQEALARADGARAFERVEAVGLVERDGRAAGVRAHDLATGAELVFAAPVVVNAAGPWAEAVAAACGAAGARLFTPALAWNVAFRRPPLSDHGLAVAPRRKGAQVYFLVGWDGMLVAGTGYAPWSGSGGAEGAVRGAVPEPELEAFIADLNAAMPGLGLRREDVAEVFAGLLPARAAGTTALAERPVIVDHETAGGPSGLHSVSGVKLTTAPAVATQVLDRTFPGSGAADVVDGRTS
jgi:glycerol-3-phosphate dehydrogenase